MLAACRLPAATAASLAGGGRTRRAVPAPPLPSSSPTPRVLLSSGERRRPRHPLPTHAPALPPSLTPIADLLRTAIQQPHPGLAAGAAANTLVFVTGARVLLAGLTAEGVAHSWLLGAASWAAFGSGGYALVCLYFLAGSAVTRLGLARKQAAGIAEARGGRRGPGSVWGSGAAGAACAAAALLLALPPAPAAAWLASSSASWPLPPLFSDPTFWRVGFIAAFASKLADTASSEVGKAYGRTTYLALPPFRLVPRGTEGAVSAEGTGAGALAALAFAAVSLALGQLSSSTEAIVVVVAATIANAFESALGAAAQGRVRWLTNDLVNVLQICVAAGLALAGRAAVAATMAGV